MIFYGKIENPAGLPEGVQKIIKTQLTSGKTITLPVWLQGGGQVYKHYFLKVIGNRRYKNAFEWCAGHGEIGFEFITNNISENITFSDIHPESKIWCLRNAEDLGISNRVSAYTSATISGIEHTSKWDLVVGNPPNSIDPDPRMLAKFKEENWSDDHQLLYARTTWDDCFRTHIEFFENIKNFITQDADIFLTVHDSVLKHAKNVAEKTHFEVIEVHNMYPADSGLKIVHFKQI